MDPGFVSLRQLNAAREQLIQSGECLIIFEPRNMMYRFVSQFVVLQFFFSMFSYVWVYAQAHEHRHEYMCAYVC